MAKLGSAFGMMGAGVDGVEPGALVGQRRDNRLLDAPKFLPAIIAVADTSLVRYHDDRDHPPISGRDYFRCTFNHDNVFGVAQIPSFFDNGPVAIEE